MRMASTQFETAAVAARAGRQASSLLRAGAAAVSRWYGRRMAVRYLQTVDDRILKDIGIERSEILSVVYGHGDGVGKYHDYR